MLNPYRERCAICTPLQTFVFSLHTLSKHRPNHHHRILRAKMSWFDHSIAVENYTLEIFCSWNVHFLRFAHDDEEVTAYIRTTERQEAAPSIKAL